VLAAAEQCLPAGSFTVMRRSSGRRFRDRPSPLSARGALGSLIARAALAGVRAAGDLLVVELAVPVLVRPVSSTVPPLGQRLSRPARPRCASATCLSAGGRVTTMVVVVASPLWRSISR